MFISDARSRYDRHGQQLAGPGDFLILVQGESPDCQRVKGIVRSVRLHQFGHWMMGGVKIDGYKLTLSGAYGADGLINTVPDDIYRRCGLELPQELYDQWAKGDGWNSAGAEAPSMRSWAKANLKALKARPAKWNVEHDGSPNLEGMDDDDLKTLYDDCWKRRLSVGREWYGVQPEAETAAGTVRQCIHWILEARKSRLSGHIDHALYIEKELLERDYQSLPEFARW